MGAAALPAAVGTTVAGGALSAYEQGKAGQASKSYYDYLASNSNINSELAVAEGEAQKKDIGAQEFQQEQLHGMKMRQTVGAQRAALVTGAGAGSKTAENIISDTLDKGNLDEMAIRYNAEAKMRSVDIGAKAAAINYRSQARGYGMAGSNALSAAKINQLSTVLGSGGSVARMFYRSPSGF